MSTLSAEDAVVLLHQAAVWHRDGAYRECEDACREALAADPGNPDALNLLAMVLHERGEAAQAAILLRRAARIEPSGRMFSNLGVVLSSARDYVGGITAYRQALRVDPLNVTAWTNLLYAIDHHPYATPELRLADRRAFDGWHCAAMTAAAPPHDNDPDPDRKLRIGYVSGDFRNHSASYAFAPVIFGRDRERYEAVLYHNHDGPPDQDTVRFKADADAWRPIAGLSDDEVARQIREDRIDILVDLSGYSIGGRLLVFARRPAPVQITGWGHATGTGLACMDYLLSDAVVIPPEHEQQYRERILRLPAVMGYDPRPPYPDVVAPPKERNGYITFGNLGRGAKLNEQTLSAWAELMRRLPTSRLILKAKEYANPVLREWALSVLAALGVPPDRVSIRGSTTRELHLATYGELDVHLDSFPTGGGITTLDACLMGVPTVTLLGDYPTGRVSASIVRTIGDFTVVPDVEEYVQIAAILAQARHDLADRLDRRRRLLDSIICNQYAYAAACEDAYREAWRSWCASRAPQATTDGVAV